jgi:hypothetical protein
MIVGAAFCPHPPLLVPEAAQGAAAELDLLRVAARTAIRRAVRPGARVVVLGAGPQTRPYAATARGSLAPYGVPLTISLGSDEPGPVELPLSLTVGAWLLRDALGPESGARGWSVGVAGFPSGEPHLDGPTALLVMGDGSARRTTAAPGYLDERAAGFDAATAAALAGGEGSRLRAAARSRALADELLVAGAPAWEAAAGLLEGPAYDAEVLYDAAPYGVGYFVAVWTGRE